MTKDKAPPALQRWIRARFFPDLIVPSPDVIDYTLLADRGFRLVFLDIDNTLVCHGSRRGDAFARRIVEDIHEAGLIPIIASNAREARARSFADSLDLEFIANAKKPAMEALCQDLSHRQCQPDHALMLGDQLLTDVWSARRAGMAVILTQRRDRREIVTVRFKRLIEWLLIRLGGKAYWDSLFLQDGAKSPGGQGYDRL